MLLLQLTLSGFLSVLIASLFKAVMPGIALFLLALIGLWLHERFLGKGWKWVTSAFASTFVIVYGLIAFLLFKPSFAGVESEALPLNFTVDFTSTISSVVVELLLLIPKSALFAVLILPFIMVSDWFKAKLEARFKGKSWLLDKARVLVACYASAYIFIVLSQVFVWLLPAILYSVYELAR